MNNSIAVFTVTICLSLGASVRADDNVREVQTKLSEEGLYSGKIDGAYSSDLSEALTRYQVRNRLPITGQLDTETSEALGVKPAVTKKSADDSAESSGVWQHLRGRDQQSTTRNNARRAASPSGDETRETSTATTSETSEQTATTVSGKQPPDSSLPRQLPRSATAISSENVKPASAPPAIASDTGASAAEFSPERLRDYVAAFVLAGLDRNVGAETEFFADRVEYYDGGLMDRDKIREDLKRYDKQWPERHFWVAGNITIEPQSDNRVRVTFPLGFKLRSGNKTFSGTVDKSLVLESTGDDLQIVEVKERKDE